MIPQILHIYWGAGKLSWLRYLTVYSFAKYNPDWKIKVWTTNHPTLERTWDTGELEMTYDGEDWFDKLKDIPNVTIHILDLETYGFHNDIPEIFKADVLKLAALWEEGGVFSDFDILYYAPTDTKDYEMILSYEPKDGYYSIGFIGSIPGNPKYKLMLEEAVSRRRTSYQSYGPLLWSNVLGRSKWWDKTVWNIPMKYVYPYNSNFIPKIYEKGAFNKPGIGLHWYGGSPLSAGWEKKITPDELADNRICNLIKEII